MWQADIPFVLAVKPSAGVWTRPPEPASPWEAANRLRWGTRQHLRHPGVWTAVVRRFPAGHEETWWAVDLRLGGSYGPDRSYRLVVATSDPRTLPKASTWYLVSNLPLPATARAAAHPPRPAADLTAVVRRYGATAGASGWSTATSTSNRSWAGRTSRSAPTAPTAPTAPSAAIGNESAAPAASAGGQTATARMARLRPLHRPARPLWSREWGKNGAQHAHAPPGSSPGALTNSWRLPSWPRALRHVQRWRDPWLDPWRTLQRCWWAWSHAPPPPTLQALLEAVTGGQPLYLSLRL
jgi:hypothetical protein